MSQRETESRDLGNFPVAITADVISHADTDFGSFTKGLQKFEFWAFLVNQKRGLGIYHLQPNSVFYKMKANKLK